MGMTGFYMLKVSNGFIGTISWAELWGKPLAFDSSICVHGAD